MTKTDYILICLVIITVIVVIDFAQTQYDKTIQFYAYNDCLSDPNTTLPECKMMRSAMK